LWGEKKTFGNCKKGEEPVSLEKGKKRRGHPSGRGERPLQVSEGGKKKKRRAVPLEKGGGLG